MIKLYKKNLQPFLRILTLHNWMAYHVYVNIKQLKLNFITSYFPHEFSDVPFNALFACFEDNSNKKKFLDYTSYWCMYIYKMIYITYLSGNDTRKLLFSSSSFAPRFWIKIYLNFVSSSIVSINGRNKSSQLNSQ